MHPRVLGILKLLVVIVVIALLIFMFPFARGFVEVAARELVYFWWLILLLLLAGWLIWGLGRKRK